MIGRVPYQLYDLTDEEHHSYVETIWERAISRPSFYAQYMNRFCNNNMFTYKAMQIYRAVIAINPYSAVIGMICYGRDSKVELVMREFEGTEIPFGHQLYTNGKLQWTANSVKLSPDKKWLSSVSDENEYKKVDPENISLSAGTYVSNFDNMTAHLDPHDNIMKEILKNDKIMKGEFKDMYYNEGVVLSEEEIKQVEENKKEYAKWIKKGVDFGFCKVNEQGRIEYNVIYMNLYKKAFVECDIENKIKKLAK